MRKLQNTLYITTQGSYLHKERETLVVEQERKKVAQLPVHSIGHIFCFGNVLVSPFLLGFCGENNVNLAFFTENGRFLGRTGFARCRENGLLWRGQGRRQGAGCFRQGIARAQTSRAAAYRLCWRSGHLHTAGLVARACRNPCGRDNKTRFARKTTGRTRRPAAWRCRKGRWCVSYGFRKGGERVLCTKTARVGRAGCFWQRKSSLHLIRHFKTKETL